MENEIAQTVPQHHRKIIIPHVTKNKQKPRRYWMNCSNNNNYMFKCYLKLFVIVADGMQGSNALAMRM